MISPSRDRFNRGDTYPGPMWLTDQNNLRQNIAGAFDRRLPNAIMARGEGIGEPPVMAASRHADTCSSDPTLRILGPRRT